MSSPSPTPPSNPAANLHWAPTWVVAAIGTLVLVAAVAVALKPLAPAASLIGRWAARPFRRPDRELAGRLDRYRRFATFVEDQLRTLAVKEDWNDQRFVELTAAQMEVEVEGRVRRFRRLRWSPIRNVALQRERSLSLALERATERLVLVAGAPGSGKSVALRHVAQRLAAKAARGRHREIPVIPLYVNLKNFRPTSRPVHADAVLQFIVDTYKGYTSHVDDFLDEEFDKGLREGKWLILLDSFDEIPDLLSAAEGDDVVQEYAEAVHNSLAMTGCRTVVASREFRAPKAFRLQPLRIMGLTERQQRDLVRRSGLKAAEQQVVLAGLAEPGSEPAGSARNPMFLGMLCEHVRETGVFPARGLSVYQAYLDERFARDATRIERTFGVGVDVTKEIAEEIAFCMTSVTGLGLSPTRRSLRAALSTGRVPAERVDVVLDALVYCRLGQSGAGAGLRQDEDTFTFAHRRFQEYLATNVVLREPDRLPTVELLTNGRWRETAVTLLQSRPAEEIAPLVDELASLLTPAAATAPDEDFTWPSGALHLIDLCNAGLGPAPEALPAPLRETIGAILRSAWSAGRRYDRRRAVELAPVADRDTTILILRQAFSSANPVLVGTAYATAGRLAPLPGGLYAGVREALLEMARRGRLKANGSAVTAQIRRTTEHDSRPLLRAVRLLRSSRYVESILGAAAIITMLPLTTPALRHSLAPAWPLTFVAADTALLFLLMLVSRSAFYPENSPPVMGIWRSASARFSRSAQLAEAVITILAIRGLLALIMLNPGTRSVALHTPGRYVPVLMLAAVVVWPTGVRHAVRHDCVTTPWRWALIPVVWMIHPLPSVWRALVEWARDSESRPALPVLLRSAMERLLFSCAVLLSAAIPLCIVVLFAGLMSNLTKGLPPELLAISGGASMAAFMLWIAAQEHRKRRRYNAEIERLSGLPLSSGELLTALERVRSVQAVGRLFAALRRRPISELAAVSEVLDDLAEHVERYRRPVDGRPRPRRPAPEFAAWLARHGGKLPGHLLQLDDAALNEVNRIVEEITEARLKSSTGSP
ncbi:MAG TPA: NACHT domain-containing protein [Spirillospora sp.]|nr:NACHT domain-containing protein [Spirillospora sp.]